MLGLCWKWALFLKGSMAEEKTSNRPWIARSLFKKGPTFEGLVCKRDTENEPYFRRALWLKRKQQIGPELLGLFSKRALLLKGSIAKETLTMSPIFERLFGWSKSLLWSFTALFSRALFSKGSMAEYVWKRALLSKSSMAEASNSLKTRLIQWKQRPGIRSSISKLCFLISRNV